MISPQHLADLFCKMTVEVSNNGLCGSRSSYMYVIIHPVSSLYLSLTLSGLPVNRGGWSCVNLSYVAHFYFN